jgi:imidazoleglycerol phosphate dehydratase HisB
VIYVLHHVLPIILSCKATQETAHVCSFVRLSVRLDQLAISALKYSQYSKIQTGLHMFTHMLTNMITHMFIHMFTHMFTCMFTHMSNHVNTHVFSRVYTHLRSYLKMLKHMFT